MNNSALSTASPTVSIGMQLSQHPGCRAIFAAALLTWSTLAVAQQAAEPPAAASCVACHGPNGNSQTAQYPSIAAQPKTFLENQLVLIREGLRPVPEMAAVVKGMSDETITALAAHYAAQRATAPAGKPDTIKQTWGRDVADKGLCGTCHLSDFRGQHQVPRLANQHEGFLVKSLKEFRDKPAPGRDTIMAATLRGMTDDDLANVAHYLAYFRP